MKLTRKDIANYKLLKVLLERDQRKLDRYIAKQPSTYSGKVYGSNPNFPYEPRGFTVGGCTDAEIRQRQEWDQKCREMEVKIQDDIRRLNELNMLNAPDTSSSGSGSNPNSGSGSGGKYTGPSASEMFETIEVPNSMNKLAEMFKDAIAKSDFTDIGRMISDKLSNALESIDWQKIYHYADNFGKDLATFLNGLITPRLFYDLGATIAGAINTAFHAANAFAIKGWKGHGYELGGFPKNGEVYVANENGFGSEMIGKMGNRNVVANNQQITDGIKEAVIDAMMEVYIATQNNGADSNGTIPYIINAVLKTEDNEVLARAVEKGQASRSSRFNPSPAY